MSARRTVKNTAEDQQLKAVTRKLIAGVGGVEAAETYCRVGKSQLSDYARPDTDAFMPVDVLKDLEAVAHGIPCFPPVTRFLARVQGFALVKLPDAAVTSGEVHLQLAELAKESNDVITETLRALADGVITKLEARSLMVACLHGAERFMQFQALLEQLSAEP